MSHRKLDARRLDRSLASLIKRNARLGLGLGAFAPVLALANPTGGQVVAGSATINTPSANDTVVKQSSQSAVIDWQQFNIGSGQYVQFLQPSSSSVILNRVVGGGSSSIYGTLTGNGQVFLVNTNGVFFGQGASIDTQGFLASTLDISDRNFMTGHYVFDQPGAPGAKVVNQGNITAHKGGYVVLAGDYAENDGIIAAQSGHVVLASGAKATLSLRGNNLVNFAVDQATLAAYAGVKNAGSLVADGGTVIMTADVANALKATVVNNVGLVQAHAISNQGGAIYLTASGGNIENAGTLDADGAFKGQAGGQIVLKGDAKTTLTSTSKIDALGQNGARGGSVEVSGNTLSMRGQMTLGKGGNLLLDPNHIEIVSGASGTVGTGGLGKGTASSSGTGVTRLGIGFIESRLDSNAIVTISAHSLIDASANAKSIKSQHGSLSLVVGIGGKIDIHGLNIAVGGFFGALAQSHATGGASASITLGRVSAGGIGIDAGHGKVTLASSAVVNKVLQPSLKATIGSIDITAGGGVLVGGNGNLDLNASKKIDLRASLSAGGNITMDAGSSIRFEDITAGRNMSLKATAYSAHVNDIQLTAGGNLSVKGELGFAPSISLSIGFDANLKLIAGGKITVDHGIYVDGTGNGISIQAQSLAFTGKSTDFVISAATGGIVLDAQIGTAAAGLKHNLRLHSRGDSIEVDKSIYIGTVSKVGRNLILQQDHGGSGEQGITVSGNGVVLSAKGDISIKGSNVTLVGRQVGSIPGIAGDAAGAITIAAGGNLLLSASAASSHAGKVSIQGGSIDRLLGGKADESVRIRAAGNVTVTGDQVDIEGGSVWADMGSGQKTLIGISDVSITAGKAVTLLGAASVTVAGGLTEGSLGAAPNSPLTRSYLAQANVSVTAGTDIDLRAPQVNVEGGRDGQFLVSTTKSKQVAHLAASADVVMKAGTFLDVDGSAGALVRGGDSAGHKAIVSATAGTALLSIKNGVSLTAGGSLGLQGGRHLVIEGGSHAAILADVSGRGVATLAVDAGVDLAGNNVSFAAGQHLNDTVTIRGGDGAAAGITVDNDGTQAKASVAADVNIKATGTVFVFTRVVDINGGNSLAGAAPSGTGSVAATIKESAVAGKASLTVNSGVLMTSGKSAELTGFSGVSIAGGAKAGTSMTGLISASGRSGAEAISLTAGVTLKAGGLFRVEAGTGSVQVRGGQDLEREAMFLASAGVLTVSAKSGVSVTGSSVQLTNGSPGFAVTVVGGDSAARSAAVRAFAGGKTRVSADASVKLAAAGKNLLLHGRGPVAIGGGAHGAQGADVRDDHGGVATLTIQQGVSLDAHGSVTAIAGTPSSSVASAGSELTLAAGGRLAASASVELLDGPGVAALTAAADVSVKAGKSLNLRAKDITLSAGRSDAKQFTLTAFSSAGGAIKPTATVDGSVRVSGRGMHASASGSLTVSGGALLAASTDTQLSGAKASARLTATAMTSIVTTSGPVSLSGRDVKLLARMDVEADDHNAKTRTDNLTITATGTGTASGTLLIAPVAVSSDGAVDRSITLHAGQNLTLQGMGVEISPEAQAKSAGAASATAATADVTITAGNDIHITGNDILSHEGVAIRPQHVTASVASGSGVSGTASAAANITITAAHDITVSGTILLFSGSGDQVRVSGLTGARKAKADVSALVTLHANHNLTLLGGASGIWVAGGRKAGQGALISAGGSHASAAATLRANVSLAAGNALAIKSSIVELNVGDSLFGRTSTTQFSASCSCSVTTHQKAMVTAGNDAKASLVASTGVKVSAGAGGVLISGGVNAGNKAVILAAGEHAGSGMEVAVGDSASATVDLEANLSITDAKGTIKIVSPEGIHVAGGDYDGKIAQVDADNFGVADLKISGTVAVTGANILLTSSQAAVGSPLTFVRGGLSGAAAEHLLAHGSHATATAEVANGVAFKATQTLTLQATRLELSGGAYDAGSLGAVTQVVASGIGDKALVTVTGGANLTGATVNLAAGGSIQMAGGGFGGANVLVNAFSSGAQADITTQANVSIKATGNLNVIAGTNSSIQVFGGEYSAASHIFGITENQSGGGVAKVSAQGDVSLAAGAGLKLQANDESFIAAALITSSGSVTHTLNGGATLDIASSILVSGHTLSVIHDPIDTTTVQSFGIVSAGGFSADASITFVKAGHAVPAPTGFGLGTLQQAALLVSLDTVLGAPSRPTAYRPAASMVEGAGGCTLLRGDGSRCRLVY